MLLIGADLEQQTNQLNLPSCVKEHFSSAEPLGRASTHTA